MDGISVELRPSLLPLFLSPDVLPAGHAYQQLGVTCVLFFLLIVLGLALFAWMQIRRVQAEQEARQRRAQLNSLRELSLEITSQLDLETLLHSIVTQAIVLLGGVGGGLFLYRPEKEALEWVVSVDDPAPVGILLRKGDGFGGRILESRRPLIVENYQEWEGRAAIFEEYGYTSLVGAPVIFEDDCLGVLIINGEPGHTFSPDDAELLTMFAAQAAIAIRNARLYEQARQEIARREEVEAVLRESEERYRSLVELSPVAIVVHIEGRIAYVNPAGVRMLGMDSPDALIGRPIMEFVHPGDRKAVQERVTRVVRGEPAPVSEEKLVTPKGDVLYAEIAAAPVTYRGEAAVLVVVHDITERVRMEQALRHYATRLQILREIDRAVLSARSPQEIAQAVLGRLQELVPSQWSVFLVLDWDKETVELLASRADGDLRGQLDDLPAINIGDISRIDVLKRGQSLMENDLTTLPDPSPAVKRLLAAGVRSALAVPLIVQGELVGLLALGTVEPNGFTAEHLEVADEISNQLAIAVQQARLHEELERHAAELSQALARQQELERLRSEFIQNVSHELRTPLAIARGYAELLEDGTLGDLSPEQAQAVSTIAGRTRGLSRLLDNFAAILDIEAHLLQPRPVDMAALVRDALRDIQPTVAEAHLTLTFDITADLPPVSGDPVHLRYAVDSLLDNAVKFTPAGGAITVRLTAADDGRACCLEVADTGIGIPPEEHERIFERFYQVNGTTTRRYGGTGLGLALVKEIVEEHGGSVSVESAVGQGSTFTVVLPTDDKAKEPDEYRYPLGSWRPRRDLNAQPADSKSVALSN